MGCHWLVNFIMGIIAIFVGKETSKYFDSSTCAVAWSGWQNVFYVFWSSMRDRDVGNKFVCKNLILNTT